jgi:hypothetical protein
MPMPARVRALAAHKDFLTLWKDADPDIPARPMSRLVPGHVFVLSITSFLLSKIQNGERRP